MKTRDKEIEIYIHIPFCVKKCDYCDFLSFPSDADTREYYVNALCSEIELKAKKLNDKTVSSIYIGGGTPSSIETKLIIKIMNTLDSAFTISRDAEVTIECNPGTVSKDGLSVYKSYGINRLSIGLQSANEHELKLLGRIHDYDSFVRTIDAVLKAGFINYSVDIMYGLPGQTLESLRKTLKAVTMFRPKHISAYSLIIEEGTPFFDRYNDDYISQCMAKKTKYLPEENVLCEMTDYVNAFLKGRGYEQYEVSNYAKAGYECRHNIGYWKRTPYIGFGLGAASLYEEVRYKNITDLDMYIKNYSLANPIIEYEEQDALTAGESMSEFMILGLRMNEGVSFDDFYNAYRMSLENVYGSQIERLINQELLVNEGNRIKPTLRGLELQNTIAREFIE